MNINSVTEKNFSVNEDSLKTLLSDEGKEDSFRATLEKSLSEVNTLINQSDQKGMELAVGKTENLHEAMITFEKAETALKFLVQVRNKALDAYHEIMRMQV